MTQPIDRRTAIAVALTAAAAVSAAACASAQNADPARAAPPPHAPVPLPVDPDGVAGLSGKLLTSHHANNYSGAVRRLNAIEQQLRDVDFASAPGFLLNGLKREELMAMNSMVLHEVYFAGLAGDARSPDAKLGAQIETDFGSLARWRTEFAAMGKALGGGSGWVLLAWSPRLGRLRNTWSSDHAHTPADGQVLMALDMYEHAYHMDYGANAGQYVDASLAAIRWNHASTAFRASGL